MVLNMEFDAKGKLAIVGAYVFFYLFHLSKQSFEHSQIKKPIIKMITGFSLSGWQDSNLRPPAPKAGAMTGLRYTPSDVKISK